MKLASRPPPTVKTQLPEWEITEEQRAEKSNGRSRSLRVIGFVRGYERRNCATRIKSYASCAKRIKRCQSYAKRIKGDEICAKRIKGMRIAQKGLRDMRVAQKS